MKTKSKSANKSPTKPAPKSPKLRDLGAKKDPKGGTGVVIVPVHPQI
jgi:hypothetical protein